MAASRKAIAVIWCLILVSLALTSLKTLTQGYTFDSNILALLPKQSSSAEDLRINQIITTRRDRELAILIGSTNKLDSLNTAQIAYTKLTDSNLFTAVSGQQTRETVNATQNFYQPWHFNFLSKETKNRLQHNDEKLASNALEKIFGPTAGISSENLLNDPLGLFQDWKISLTKDQVLSIDNDWLTLKNNETYYRFIRLQLKQSAFEPTYQQKVKDLLNELSSSSGSDTQVLASGLIIHATHGSEQAKKEISTIGFGSILAIGIILLMVFRRIQDLFLIFLPLALGSLFSFSICLLVFDRIHLITLAFGTSLIGIAIDYSLHYLCAQRETLSQPVLRRIFPGLILALISSVTAYIAQAMAPFPGLRQMAVFAALGLVGAWITVVLILPLVSVRSANTNSRQRLRLFAAPIESVAKRWSTLSHTKLKPLLLISGLIITAFAIQVKPDDNLKSLQTSPDHLINNDINFSRLLNTQSIGHYFLVQGLSPQDLLEHEEQLSEELDKIKLKGLISGYQATSLAIPSIKTQSLNHQLLKDRVYADNAILKSMFTPLGMIELEQAMKATFDATPFTGLTFSTWKNSAAAKPFDHLWVGNVGGKHYSMVTLVGSLNEASKQELADIADNLQSTRFINRPQSISHVLTQYRESLFELLLLAYTLVSLLLLLRYKREAINIVAPPLIASLIVLAYLALTSTALTVFHCLALLLVLGIGLDAAIFLKETHASSYTWLAVSLSSITTFLAFGLLSFSQTPVLHFFGQTVAVGIIAIWLTAPIFCIPKDNHHAIT